MRARRLALSVSEPNRSPLLEYADELEAEAYALECAVPEVTRKQDHGQQQKAERRGTSRSRPPSASPGFQALAGVSKE